MQQAFKQGCEGQMNAEVHELRNMDLRVVAPPCSSQRQALGRVGTSGDIQFGAIVGRPF